MDGNRTNITVYSNDIDYGILIIINVIIVT